MTTIQVHVDEGDESKALAWLHAAVPASKPLKNLVAGNLRVEADIETPIGDLRIELGVQVGTDGAGG